MGFHAAQASNGNFQKTDYKTFGTSYRPRLYIVVPLILKIPELIQMLKMSSSVPRLAHGRVADDEKLEHVVEVLIGGILLPRLALGRHLSREQNNPILMSIETVSGHKLLEPLVLHIFDS